MEFALAGTKVQFHFREFLKYPAYVDLVFSNGVAVNQDVVKVGGDKVVQEGSEYVIDKVLKRRGSVGKAIGHHQGFKEAVAGAKGRLPLFSLGHADQVVGVPYVEDGVVTGFGETVQGFSYQGKWIPSLDRSNRWGHGNRRRAVGCRPFSE